MVQLKRLAVALLLGLVVAGCSSQPLTLEQELTVAGVGAMAGAGGGALVGSQTHYSIPLSIFIGAAGTAALLFLYQEVKRESADYPLNDPSSH